MADHRGEGSRPGRSQVHRLPRRVRVRRHRRWGRTQHPGISASDSLRQVAPDGVGPRQPPSWSAPGPAERRPRVHSGRHPSTVTPNSDRQSELDHDEPRSRSALTRELRSCVAPRGVRGRSKVLRDVRQPPAHRRRRRGRGPRSDDCWWEAHLSVVHLFMMSASRRPKRGTTDGAGGHEAVAQGSWGAMPARSNMITVMNA